MVILETKLSMSLWCKGVSVKVFYKSNNLINEFMTIISIAKYFGIFIRTIGRYLKINLILVLFLDLNLKIIIIYIK